MTEPSQVVALDAEAAESAAALETRFAHRSRFRRALSFLQVRLRFFALVAALFLLFGQWETISNYWGWAWRQVTRGRSAEQGVSPDTEYFCPMCPGVLSAWPSKCPVCNMPLVQRQTGEAPMLPEGVTARMQFSPYRLQLAGVRTAPVEYRSLVREITALGTVQQNRDVAGGAEGDPRVPVELDLPVRDAALLAVDDPVEVMCHELRPRGPWLGTVAAIEPKVTSLKQRVRVHVECPQRDLPAGAIVEVAFRTPLADVEPFRSLPRDPPPLSGQDSRTVYICPDHRDVIALRPGVCPRDSLDLAPEPLAANQRVSFWCPMHPKVTAASDGHSCAECQGMKLLPRVVTYAPLGQVLAVPESAAIITGKRQFVYVESGPGMFDAVAVKLGPKADGYYSVLEGLAAGQRVASAGAFLIDAETQLNPHLAAAYFGAGGASAAGTNSQQNAPTAPKPEKDRLAGIALSPADMALARRQKVCPVTKMPLGSMGKPVRVEAAGRITFLCCEGCRTKFLDSVGEAAKND
jgi:hypothetical protein